MKKSSEIWPKRPIRIVVWVEGEIRGYEVVRKHSKRVLACGFALFRSLARTVKIACWGAGLRWRPQSVKRFEALTEPTGETIPDPYEERRAALTAERQKARREEQDYAAVRRNVEEFLSPPRQKDMELKCPLGQTFCRDLRFPLSFCRNVRYNEDINDFEGGEPHDKRRGIAALFYRSGYHIVACAVASILLHES